ncbi:GNAT family N-acetyltransferase [Desulfosporosinus sp. PR]|uniref:GNAT family N-acetyltransferase n=1 Tax=Candidatus Desulfosporosinus nitrosoreducens TaxID=3401928 RepID=UPI0027F0B9E8|nr:GNAT family N-acetyltransferase [Desulfosporosinus sp. PR]MDQ7096103.1 GNAT family N-acetyltransferase [Desulfosporosinus sp. PR]
MRIRVMSIEDYDEVYQLWTSTEGMGMRSLDDSPAGIEKFLRRNPTTNYVAQIENRIIGVILCGHDGRRGYIYHTAVRPDFRGKGIGKALVKAAASALRLEGINKVALVVFAANDLGNKFWESIGFIKRSDLMYRNLSINDMNV